MRTAAVVLLLLGAPSFAQAQSVDLHRVKERLESVRMRLESGAAPEGVTAEISSLRTAYERRVRRLEAELERVRRLPLGPVAAERLEKARAAFERSERPLLGLLTELAESPDLGGVEACLEALSPVAEAEREDLLSASELPLRELELAPPPLSRGGPKTTAGFDAEIAGAADPIGVIPEAIQDIADEVDGAVAAYELVKNQTRFELYFGSMKGSVQTFREGSGNDADINRLLVDLLRAEGIPARYVRGVVRLTIDQAKSWIGTGVSAGPGRVEQAFSSAAVPYEPQFIGGGIGAIDKEHVWVEAYVPWSNYRGVGVDTRGRRWVPLDASFKLHTVEEGLPVLEDMGFDGESFVRSALVAPPQANPMVELRSQVTSFLNANSPGTSYEEALRKLVPQVEVYGLLPASLPYEVLSIQGVSFDFPEELEHRVRLLATGRGGEVILDRVVPVPRVLGSRLTLSYTPAEEEDREIAASFGSLYLTPPFLVRVRPVVRSAGLVIATGEPIDMGGPFELQSQFVAPAGSVTVTNRMIAGAYAALAISGRTPGYEEAAESQAGEILNQRALNYLARWNEIDRELSGLTRVLTFRPVPSHVIVKNAVEVEYASVEGGGTLVPLTFEWKGIQVDADLRPVAAVPAELEGDRRRDFFFLSGLAGSELEGRVLEEDLGINAISTVELLRLATSRNVEVREIDRTNVDTELAAIDLEPELEDAIATHAHLGRVIQAPSSELTFLAWTGSGFTAWDPTTGESAYMLSGRIAGGSSADDPADFPPTLFGPLQDPTEPISEPGHVVGAIEKVAETDLQEALVGTEVPLPLEVLVTDARGEPIADGVPVTFRAVDAGSVLASEDQVEEGPVVTVATRDGRARARLGLGTSTRDNPLFVLENPGDPFLTQAGLYRVTVEAGGVQVKDSFRAFAFPDPETDGSGRHGRLRYVCCGYEKNPLLSTRGFMWVDVIDRFGNPLSNMPVNWEVKEAERLPGIAEPLPDEFENAKIEGADGALLDRDTRLTSFFGGRVFARMGNVDATRYKVEATTSDSKYPGGPIVFLKDSDNFGSGIVRAAIGERLVPFYVGNGLTLRNSEIVFEDGGHRVTTRNLAMGPAGGLFPRKVEFLVRAYQEDYEPAVDAQGKWLLEGKGTFTVREITDASVTPILLSGDGAFHPATVSQSDADGFYPFLFQFGKAAGVRRYGFSVEALLKRPVVDRESGDITIHDVPSSQGNTDGGRLLFGVTARFLAQSPDPIILDSSGHIAQGSTIGFEILPSVVDEALSLETFGRSVEIRENGKLFSSGELPAASPLPFNTATGYDPKNVYEARIGLVPGTFLELFSSPVRLQFFSGFMKKSNPKPILVREVPDPDDPAKRKLITPENALLEYFILPTQLPLEEASVEVMEVDRESGAERVVKRIPGDEFPGDGRALLEKSFEVDLAEKEYKSVLNVQPAGRPLFRSEPTPILFNRLIYGVRDPVRVVFETGATNVCFVPEDILYHLDAEADVTISVVELQDDRPISEQVVFEGRQPRTTGGNDFLSFTLGPTHVPNPGRRYKFRIQATAVDEPQQKDQFIDDILVESHGNVVLPVGHTFVKGVDLLDGHLVSSSTDFSIPGRGPSLELVRTYSSAGSSNQGVMGAGWAMNYFSTLVISNCFWTVVGGDGSGQRFTQVGDRFVPQKGYHTELVRNNDGSFDFFTKGRVRYHYLDRELFEGDRLYGGRPTLEFIEDPNGNRVELAYDAERNITGVKEVFQGGLEGRSLAFEYMRVLGEARLKRVVGPLGLEVEYAYDEFGNLIEAKRDERVERYEYKVGNPQDRHNLVAYTDPNRNTTRYRYFEEGAVFPGEIDVDATQGKHEWVKAVDEPEGATTEFVYDLTRISSGELVTTVTDARRNGTIYTLNLNGSPLRIEEPRGVVTAMTWAANDIVKESETDANGRLTTFRYDARGNLTRETIATSDRGDVVTEFEYHPLFNKMTLKRVHNDVVVQETRFVINDANGNLDQMTDAEGNLTEYLYSPNGDLERVTGPRMGQVTEFTYDDFGNPFTTTDGEGNVTTTVYDERSRLTSSEDTLGRRMEQSFDELDRVTTMTRTDDRGSSDPEVVVRDYYPGGQVLFETNGLGLRTDFGIDGLNRVTGTRDSLGNTTTAKYDGNGNVELKTDRRRVTTIQTYDELNRLTAVVVNGPFGPVQTVTVMDYDGVGNKLFETDIHGSRTDFEYDGLYRVSRRLLPTGHAETFTYDDVGNKLTETDANGHTAQFLYDRLNRLVLRTDAEGNQVRMGYDESGNLRSEEDLTRGLETRTEYDFLNRPLTRTVTGAAPNGFTYLTTFVYDDPAHSVIETDPRGFTKTTVLDGFDRVHEVRQDTGTEELVTLSFYDANGNLKRSVDGEGRDTVFVYDGLNRLKEVRDALGGVSSFEYDGEANKVQEVSRRNVTSRFRYDNLGRLTRTEMDRPLSQKSAVSTTVFYNDATRERVELDARGAFTRFLMDERARVIQITDADGKEQRFEYDGVNKTAEIDKREHRTVFRYDRINRPTQTIDPLRQTMTTTYFDEERRVLEVDKKGISKTTQLDALGRLISVTRAQVRLEQHEYDSNNRILSTDANGNQTRFVYDGANRLTARTDGQGSDVETTTSFRYDRVGNLLEEKDGRDTGVTFDVRNTYDDLNRLETATDGEGNVTTYEYDPDGNRTALIEPKGPPHRTEYDYGERNELLEVRMPDGGVYRYDYDPNLNRIEQVDGEGNRVAFTYDKLNRLDLMTQDPGGFNYVTDHNYDPNGNEIKLTDPKGQVITYDYDELNRLKFKVYNLTAADLQLFTRTHRIDYQYDRNDNLIRVDETKSSGTDPPAVVSSFKTHDDLDRLETETDAWGRQLFYDYDDQGNRTLLIDPDQKRTVYGYDELNRLETLTLSGGQVVRYEYFPDGLKKKVTNPNGTTSTYLYDAADRMTDISHSGPTGVVSAYQYFYDANSNRERQVETNAGRTETTEYTYDFVNRLKTVSYPNQAVAYGYDQAGNRTRELTTGAEASDETLHYDAINRLDRITDTTTGDELTRYGYDPNGNTTQKTKEGITSTFHYDIRNQLGEVRESSNILGRYGYDYDGRRILKIGDDGRRQYTYDQLSVVTEADQVNATVSKYDYGIDQLVRLDNRGEGRSFFHLDALRSTVSLTAADGVSRQSIFYDAWGNERERIGSSANHFTFTGHELDEETGLIYAKARFYDSEIGRFLSQDSLLGTANEPPSLHRYSYTLQNPLVFVDPNGREAAAISLAASRGETFDPFERDSRRRDAFATGALNTVTEPFKEVYDVARLSGAVALDLDPLSFELYSSLGQASRFRAEQGQGAASNALEGSANVARAVGTFGIAPFLDGQIQLARAAHAGTITIDEYEEGLYQLAGGATAVAILSSATEASAGRGWRGNQTGKPGAQTVKEGSVQNEGIPEPVRTEPSQLQTSGPLKNRSGDVEQAANTARSYNPKAEASKGPITDPSRLLPPTTLDDVIAANYQRYYNEAASSVIARFNAGRIKISEGQNWRQVLGQRIDAEARARMLNFLQREGIAEGPGADVLVNRWLRDPSGSGHYRIPDIMLRQTGRILEGTIGDKAMTDPQIVDYRTYSGGFKVEIVRPQTPALRVRK